MKSQKTSSGSGPPANWLKIHYPADCTLTQPVCMKCRFEPEARGTFVPQMNYLKFASKCGDWLPNIKKQFDGKHRTYISTRPWHQKPNSRANLRLVVSIAKRHVGPARIFELMGDGNMSLMRARRNSTPWQCSALTPVGRS
jgi:hypothetical protein